MNWIDKVGLLGQWWWNYLTCTGLKNQRRRWMFSLFFFCYFFKEHKNCPRRENKSTSAPTRLLSCPNSGQSHHSLSRPRHCEQWPPNKGKQGRLAGGYRSNFHAVGVHPFTLANNCFPKLMQETDASQTLMCQKETLFQPPSTENFTPTSDKHMVNCWLAVWSAQWSLAPTEQSVRFKLLVFLIVSPSFLFPDLHLHILAFSGNGDAGKSTFVWKDCEGTLGKVDNGK